MWEENETYEGVFLVTFVNYGRLEYKKLTLSVETETLTKIQEAKLLIEAYKQFIDEYILDEDNSITHLVEIKFVDVKDSSRDFINDYVNPYEEADWEV
mgnify:CR=1 FL=1